MTIAIIGTAPELEAQLRQAVASSAFTVSVMHTPETLAELSSALGPNPMPDVVILVPAGEPGEALPLTRVLSAEQRTGVIIAAPLQGQQMIGFTVDAMRAGAADVVSTSPTLEELRSALARGTEVSRRAAQVARAVQATTPVVEQERGTLIAVGSAVGGVGKTTMAVNLAVGIAGIDPGRAALLDAAPQFGGVADQLDLLAVYGLSTIVGASDSIAAKSYLSLHEASGLYVAPADEEVSDGLASDQVAMCADMLAHQFRTVVADTPSGLPSTTLELLARADQLLVVSDFSVHSLRATRTYLATLDHLPRRTPLLVKVLLNRFDKAAGLTRKDAEETIGRTADLVLDNQPLMLYAANRGVPPMLAPAKDKLRQDLSPLIGLFHDGHAAAPKRASRRFGL